MTRKVSKVMNQKKASVKKRHDCNVIIMFTWLYSDYFLFLLLFPI